MRLNRDSGYYHVKTSQNLKDPAVIYTHKRQFRNEYMYYVVLIPFKGKASVHVFAWVRALFPKLCHLLDKSLMNSLL